MKTIFGTVKRGGFNHFITAPLPFRPAPAARFDAWGVVIVVGLFAGMLILMRLLLAN